MTANNKCVKSTQRLCLSTFSSINHIKMHAWYTVHFSFRIKWHTRASHLNLLLPPRLLCQQGFSSKQSTNVGERNRRLRMQRLGRKSIKFLFPIYSRKKHFTMFCWHCVVFLNPWFKRGHGYCVFWGCVPQLWMHVCQCTQTVRRFGRRL